MDIWFSVFFCKGSDLSQITFSSYDIAFNPRFKDVNYNFPCHSLLKSSYFHSLYKMCFNHLSYHCIYASPSLEC